MQEKLDKQRLRVIIQLLTDEDYIDEFADDAFNDYANGRMSKIDFENVKSGLKSKIDNVAQTNNNLTLALKDFMENKGTFDIGASDKEMVLGQLKKYLYLQ